MKSSAVVCLFLLLVTFVPVNVTNVCHIGDLKSLLSEGFRKLRPTFVPEVDSGKLTNLM